MKDERQFTQSNTCAEDGKGGRFPRQLECIARVTPVYKKGDATDPKNYWPVSVLLTLATTFERVVMPQLSSFLYEHIPLERFGFLRSTSITDGHWREHC